jgi:hypothetical protein
MQPTYNCPQCGKPVIFGNKYCETCGTQLTWPSQSQQQPLQQYSKPPKKKKKGWLIALLSVVGLVIIIFIIAVASGSSEKDTSPPLNETDTSPLTTSSESEYIGKLNVNSSSIGEALIKLGELLQNYEPDSDEWTLQTAGQIVIIQNSYKEAKEFNPPASMIEIHDKYISSTAL